MDFKIKNDTFYHIETCYETVYENNRPAEILFSVTLYGMEVYTRRDGNVQKNIQGDWFIPVVNPETALQEIYSQLSKNKWYIRCAKKHIQKHEEQVKHMFCLINGV